MRTAHCGLLVLSVMCCLLTAVSCGGSAAPASGAAMDGSVLAGLLPPPAALRQASAGQVVVLGKDYNAAWPNGKVSAAGNDAKYSPTYAGVNRTLADLAYAVYALDVAGFTGDSTLYFTFTTPSTAGNGWIGLADYAAGRWDWYELPEPAGMESILVITLANRDSAGVMPVAVAFTGTAECQLKQLQLGDVTQVEPGAWPMSGHDVQQTFRSAEQGPATNAIRWQVSSFGANPSSIFRCVTVAPDGTVLAGADDALIKYAADGTQMWSCGGINPLTIPAVAADGTVYVGGAAPTAGLHAVSSTGTKLWSYPTTMDVYGAPAIRPDGKIYFGCDDGNLYCLNADGTKNWEHSLVQTVHCSPAVDAAGAVYIGYYTDAWGNDGYLLALNPDGSQKWEYNVGEPLRSRIEISPNGNVLAITKSGGLLAVDQDGGLEFNNAVQSSASSFIVTNAANMIFFGTKSGTIRALNPDGSEAWTYTADNEVLVASEFDSNGNIVGASINGGIFTCSPDGAEAWIADTGEQLFVPPAAGGGLTVVTNNSGGIFAYDATGAEQWRSGTGGPVVGSPAVTTGGTVYFGSADGYLYAVRPDGSIKWLYQASTIGVSCGPAIGTDGTIYIGSKDNKLCAVKPDGTELWTFATTGYVEGSPVIDQNGTIYCGSNDTNLYAVYPDGSKKWEFKTKYNVGGSPAVGLDGTVYVASWDSRVYAVKSYGEVDWEYKTDGAIKGGVCLGQGGVIYAGCEKDPETGMVYAISPSGSKLWSVTTVGPVRVSPALTPDGDIVVSTCAGYAVDGYIYAISASGTQMWQYGPAPAGTASMTGAAGLAVDADGVIYAGTTSGQVLALNNNGSSASVKWSYDAPGAAFYTPAVDAGRLYIGTGTGVLAFSD